MKLEDIKKTLAASKAELAQTFKVKEIGVFGSYARGEETEQSDVDVLVTLSEPVGFFLFIELEEHLAAILGRKVDLVTKRALKPGIGRNILRDLVTV